MNEDNRGLDESRLFELFDALNDRDVDYAVFGAVALGLHGLGRSTASLDLFLRPEPENVRRLLEALHSVFADPEIDEITSEDLCGDVAVVRYIPPVGFSIDLVTRLGEAFAHDDLEVEEKAFADTRVKVVTARTLWLMKKDTLRQKDQFDAAALAERFGFEEGRDDGPEVP